MRRFSTLALSLLTACLPALADNTTQTVGQVTTAVTLDQDVDYHITSATPFTATGSINLTDTAHAVIILDALKPSLALNQLGYITINGQAAVNGRNCQVKIYDRGAIIMPYGSGFKPLTVYTEANFQGESCNDFDLGNSGGFMQTLTTKQLNNRIKSFRLKRGYMVTFSLRSGGQGYSRCFIADKADLEINLPKLMQNRISSYRLFKWNDVSKAGLGGNTGYDANNALNTQWCFDWGTGQDAGIDREVVPHHIYEDYPSASACGSVNYTTSSPHMQTNNEPRNSADDHPQTLTEILNNWESLMRTGQRLCSPSSWDGSPSFNQEFLDSIDARGWRCDILDIHAYWATGSFYQLYNLANNAGRPIWITEWCWGASWNHNGAFADGVTESQVADAVDNICGLLNRWDYVERYAYWNSERDPSRLYKNNALTETGKRYATMDPGLAYNASANTYIPSGPRTYAPTGLELSFRPDRSVATLTWSDRNGELNDSMWIERKIGTDSRTKWEYYKGVNVNDDPASYTFRDTIETPGYYIYRVGVRTYNGSLLYTGEVTNNIAGSTSIGTGEEKGTVQYGTITTGSSEEGYLYFDKPFTEQPAIVFGSLSNRNTNMMPVQRVSNVYQMRDQASGERLYSFFRYSVYPLNRTSSSSQRTDFYSNFTDYTSYMAAKAGNGTLGKLRYEAGVSANAQVNDTVDVTFSQPFADTPVVLVSPIMAISSTERYPVETRPFDITPTGFRVVLQRQKVFNDENTLKRTLKFSYIAVEKGQTTDEAGRLIIVKDTTVNFMTDSRLSLVINFDRKLPDLAFLTQLQTLNHPSMAVLRTRPVSIYDTDSLSTRIRLQVDDTDSAEPTRSNPWEERVGWIAFSTDPDNTPTAIKGITTVEPVSEGRAVYTLGGVKLGTSLDRLPAGVYIVRENGTTRKVLKR